MLSSGHKWSPISDEEQEKQKKLFKGYGDGMIRLQPDNWFFMNNYHSKLDWYYNFKFKPTDIVVMTYPKCGTTWTQEIVWTMKNNPNLDHPDASLSVNERTSFLECDGLIEATTVPREAIDRDIVPLFEKSCSGKNPENGIFHQLTEIAPDPRIIKTHLPLSLLPPDLPETCKIVYVARNPKDVCMSYHHHSRVLKVHFYEGSLDEFVDFFVNDQLMWSPYGTHLKEAWKLKNHKNFHFMFYEDLKRNPEDAYRSLDKFLETNLTDTQIKNVIHQSSFTVMKSKDNAQLGDDVFMIKDRAKNEGGFFRKGTTGSSDEMTAEQQQKIDQWVQKTCPEIRFRY